MSNNFMFSKGGMSIGGYASDPLNGKAGDVYYNTSFNKFKYYNGTSWKFVGSGSGSGGGGGVNFVGVDSTLQQNNTDDVDFETTIGNWIAFADAASPTPTDMTGGSPTVAISRTTTPGEVLNGTGSAKVVKDAANRQGEGVSVDFYVPPGYVFGQQLIRIPYKVISGSIVQGDLKIYAYDITNGKLLTPVNNNVLGTQAISEAIFRIDNTCAQLRIGFYFASTSTTAVTFVFDDVFTGNSFLLGSGPVITDPIQDTFLSTNNFGTTVNNFQSHRQGKKYCAEGNFEAGTPSAATASLTLPAGMEIDFSQWTGSDHQMVGFGIALTNLGSAGAFQSYSQVLFVKPSDPNKVYFASSAGSVNGEFIDNNANSILTASGQKFTLYFEVPIKNWSAQTPAANSSIIRMSDWVSTRVTASPAAFGEFRTLIKDNSAFTLSDDAPTQTIADIRNNGFRIFSVNGTGPGNSGDPNEWSFYIGPNKVVSPEFYSGTGRTGKISTDFWIGGTQEDGLVWHYDKTTGVFTIRLGLMGNTGQRKVGVSFTDTGQSTDATDCYFDVNAADDLVALQLLSPTSEVRVSDSTSPGYGSTNTKIRVFANIEKNVGSDIEYNTSATDGDSFVIKTNGTYAITYSDYRATAAGAMAGITVNATLLTTDVGVLTYAQGFRAGQYMASADIQRVANITLKLNAGDVVRAHSYGNFDVSPSTTNTLTYFHIVRLS